MQKKTRRGFERLLLITGLIIACIGLLSEAINYPWKSLLGEETMPDDPEPASTEWVTESVAANTIVYLPGDESFGETIDPVDDILQVGIIKVPKLGEANNIVEGLNKEKVNLGLGHMPGTALPGQEGNCVLTSVRTNAIMKHLGMLEAGDTILISDQQNQYTYTVYATDTVEPTDAAVTQPVDGKSAVLTVYNTTTAYISSSTDRYIVQAELTDTQPLA